MKTKFTFMALVLFLIGVLCGGNVFEQQSNKTIVVGGTAIYPIKNIIENVVNSRNHTTLVAVVKSLGLV